MGVSGIQIFNRAKGKEPARNYTRLPPVAGGCLPISSPKTIDFPHDFPLFRLVVGTALASRHLRLEQHHFGASVCYCEQADLVRHSSETREFFILCVGPADTLIVWFKGERHT
jgi:hypothetical protein